MPEPAFAAFLWESFAVLRRELPETYRRLCSHLSPREVAIQVGDESVVVRFEPRGAQRLAVPVRPQIEVHTTRAAILSLIDARSTLVESILGDELLLRGTADELLRFHDALMIYVHGAIRAPSFPHLLRAYRRDRDTHAAGDGPEQLPA
jgi:hypothetical protein